jgi:hypothetical protein
MDLVWDIKRKSRDSVNHFKNEILICFGHLDMAFGTPGPRQ